MGNAELRDTNGKAEKRCTKCGEWKLADLNYFGPLKEGRLGFHPWCRACHREYRRSLDAKRPRIRKNGPQISVDAPPRQSEPIPKYISVLISSLPDEVPTQSLYKAYLVTNTMSGEKYIGITERRIKDRWRQHIQESRADKGYLLHMAIRQYGPEKFRCEHIASAKTRSLLGELEQQLIEQFATVEHGYNQTRGGSAGEAVGNPVSIDGRTYISLASAAREYGLTESNVFQRINKYGWTLEQALELEPRPRRRSGQAKPCEVSGRRFPSFIAACEEHKIEESVARSRLKIGWTNNQAFGIDPPPVRGRNVGTSINVGGKHFKSKAQAATRHGLKPEVFTRRIRQGWTPEQAAEIDLPPPAKEKEGTQVSVEGNDFVSISALARAFEKNSVVVKTRLDLGWTPEQAIDLVPPPPPSGEKNGRPFTVEGITYSSRAKAAKAYSLDPRSIHKRLKAGWSVGEAFELVPRKSDIWAKRVGILLKST